MGAERAGDRRLNPGAAALSCTAGGQSGVRRALTSSLLVHPSEGKVMSVGGSCWYDVCSSVLLISPSLPARLMPKCCTQQVLEQKTPIGRSLAKDEVSKRHLGV